MPDRRQGRWLLGPVIATPWGLYARRRRLFWRLRIPLLLAACAAGSLIGEAAHLPASVRAGMAVASLATAGLAEIALSYRRVQAGSGASRAAAEAAIRRRQRRETAAVPSPAGWVAPSGTLPAWNWVPPGGIVLRMERVPRWVRVWQRVPFADRYAHAWMWHHGGWDVLPPMAS